MSFHDNSDEKSCKGSLLQLFLVRYKIAQYFHLYFKLSCRWGECLRIFVERMPALAHCNSLPKVIMKYHHNSVILYLIISQASPKNPYCWHGIDISMQTFEPAMIQPIWFLKLLKPVATMKPVAMTSQESLLLARD